MASNAKETICDRFLAQGRRRGAAPAYYVKKGGEWQPNSWSGFVGESRQAARALMALGFKPGDKVCTLGFNRPEWVIFHWASMLAGGANAGIYTTCSATEVQYIVHHAEAVVTLVEDAAQWEKIRAQRDNLPGLHRVVLMKGAPQIDDPMVLGWEAFLALAGDVDEARVDECVAALDPAELATLIYTSGTTGPPKGVMLSHENLLWTAEELGRLTGIAADDRVLSYLPLSHIAEQQMSIYGGALAGGSAYFAQSIETVADDLREVQPTMFFGVPRIWEKFHAAISSKLAAATGAKKALLDWTMRVAGQRSAKKNAGERPGLAVRAQFAIVNKLVISKLKPAIGLGNARMCVSGAAPISKEILEFFAGLDIAIHEIYGQSEDTGPTSFNVPGKTKLGSVGQPLPGIEVKIADDGEILIRGKNVFLGYYKEPEATAEALVDGWLHSGDLGEFDAKGFLNITGRKKDIIITAGGKNIAPKNIEAALKNSEYIDEAVVIGDRRKYLVALVTADPERLGEFGADGTHSPRLAAEIQSVVDEINTTLARVEQIKKFAVLPRSFTVETGELTPTLKVKRNKVYENFKDAIETLYAE